jgi:hypothetical protein
MYGERRQDGADDETEESRQSEAQHPSTVRSDAGSSSVTDVFGAAGSVDGSA